jgi:hypothetical protein
MDVFSPAQCVGYVAFVVGILAFLQKSDKRLKVLNASECLVYAVHFVLLGNLPASASSMVSGLRSLLALRTKSPMVALSMLVIGLALGVHLAKDILGWLPIIASSIATVAVFLMRGVPMRLFLLSSTLLWLANNIVSGSIGGTLLEATIAVVNVATILRLRRDARAADARGGAEDVPTAVSRLDVTPG